MKKLILTSLSMTCMLSVFAQPKKIMLYDLVKKLITDSSEYETVGDWGVGRPSAYPVQWIDKNPRISEDLKVNFFRRGKVNLTVSGHQYDQPQKAQDWQVLLTGARSGYSSFKVTSPLLHKVQVPVPLDSLFGRKPYQTTLLNACTNDPAKGFYYYLLQIPNKTSNYIKLSWTCSGENCTLTLNSFDGWSQQYAELECTE